MYQVHTVAWSTQLSCASAFFFLEILGKAINKCYLGIANVVSKKGVHLVRGVKRGFGSIFALSNFVFESRSKLMNRNPRTCPGSPDLLVDIPTSSLN